jgi:hypothetical protein
MIHLERKSPWIREGRRIKGKRNFRDIASDICDVSVSLVA